MTKVTKEVLLEEGIMVDDTNCFAKKSKAIFEPPVRVLDTNLINSGIIGAYTNLRGGTIRNLKSIGRFCNVAPGVTIGMGEHPLHYLSTHDFQYADKFGYNFWDEAADFDTTVDRIESKPSPVIGNDVWIGSNVTILKGVTIGDGAVIAASAVVNKDVEPYSIVGGIPAKHIKYRFDESMRERLLQLQWWNYTMESLEGIQFDDIETAVQQLEERKEEGKLTLRNNPRVKVINKQLVNKKPSQETKEEDDLVNTGNS
ncbi:CatB-related O-acetyltransferase [Halobacillus litoralis]|uniref:CatB-related O-acetyltransferase n=1 Tax=Halobacillus litoralis TaxID=45668 RepID=UPI001369C06B|nr:CatB-related O-acetyltransferase [Halobacillus litoralis]MYL36432.1 antibiotic acetyltransferase [Halobacillus litoralis]